MTLVTPSDSDIEGAIRTASLPRWLGTHHPLPYRVSNRAVILVTHSRTPGLVGKIMPVRVEAFDGVVKAYARGSHEDVSKDTEVDGVIYDPEGNRLTCGQDPTVPNFVVAPYNQGWVYGRLAANSTPERPRIIVQGGVGVPAPIIDKDSTAGWTVAVPYVFKVDDNSAVPKFTDNYAMLHAKMQSRFHRSKERMVQTVLTREMQEREYTENVDVDEFPKFKHRNAYYAVYDLDVVLPSPYAELDIEKVMPKVKDTITPYAGRRFSALYDDGHSMSAKEAIIVNSENQIVIPIHAGHPEEAMLDAQKRALDLVKSTYGSTAGLMRINEIEIYFAGVN